MLKTILPFLLLIVATVCTAQQNKILDVNYNLSYRDISGFRFSTKLMEIQDWSLRDFKGSAYYNILEGSSKLSFNYDVYRPANTMNLSTRYSLLLSTTGPNSNLSFQLSYNTNYAKLDGWYGKLDWNVRFK